MRLPTLAAVTLFAVLALASPAFATSVTNPTVDNASPSAAAGARTLYKVGFSTSTPNGPLRNFDGSQIRVTFATGTTFTGYGGGTVRDVTTAQDVGTCGSPSGLLITCSLGTGEVINAGDAVLVTFRAVTTPSAPVNPLRVTVST